MYTIESANRVYKNLKTHSGHPNLICRSLEFSPPIFWFSFFSVFFFYFLFLIIFFLGGGGRGWGGVDKKKYFPALSGKKLSLNPPHIFYL